MKRYVRPMSAGGLNFRHEDFLDCLQDEQYDALVALIIGVGGPGDYVLSGCNVTFLAPNLSISPGYVFIDEDIHRFNGYAGPSSLVPEPIAYIKISTSSIVQRLFRSLLMQDATRETNTVVDMNTGIPINTTGPAATVLTSIINIINNTVIVGGNVSLSPIIDCLPIAPTETNLNVIVAAIRSMLCANTAAITMFTSLMTTIEKKGTIKMLGIVGLFSPLTFFDGTGLGFGDWMGWALCNGQNNAPNMLDRFVVGYNPVNPGYSALGITGGDLAVTLLSNQIPTHNHGGATGGQSQTHTHPVGPIYSSGFGFSPNQELANDTDSGDVYLENTGPQTTDHTHGISSHIGDQPHENRPPYFVVGYVIKIV